MAPAPETPFARLVGASLSISLALMRGAITWVMRVLLPEPETPVMAISAPRGMVRSRPCMLLQSIPLISSQSLASLALPFGRMIRPLPSLSIFPVREASFLTMSSTCPWATTSPPKRPPPGPRSMIQSAERRVSSSCSTTMRVLPAFFREQMAERSLLLSVG